MEPWKIGVILALVLGLGGYGIYQQNAPIAGDQLANQQPTPAKPANEKLVALKGKVPPAWDIPKNYWLNTPAPITQVQTKGKVTVLEFFRIGCPHCQDAVPFMNRLYATYKPRGVEFIAVHTPGNIKDPANPELNWSGVQSTIKGSGWGIKYPVAYDEEGKLFQKVYGGDTYPALLILDRSGKVAVVETGYGHSPQDKAKKEKTVTTALESVIKQK